MFMSGSRKTMVLLAVFLYIIAVISILNGKDVMFSLGVIIFISTANEISAQIEEIRQVNQKILEKMEKKT